MKYSYKNLEIEGRIPEIENGDGAVYRLDTNAHAFIKYFGDSGMLVAKVHASEEDAVRHYHEFVFKYGYVRGRFDDATREFSPLAGEPKKTTKAHRAKVATPPQAEEAAPAVNEIEFPEALAISVDDLEPHPDAAAYPRRAGDNEAVAGTIDEGVHEPLIVARKEGGGGWWVLDGCSRLAAAREAGLGEVPCIEVKGVRDARRYALVKNGMRRRVSTGTRVLAYVEMNYAEIMAAQPSVSYDTDKGEVSRKTPISGDRWQTKAIAKRMNVSNKDVVAALLLTRCLREGRLPAYNEKTKRQEIGEEASAEEMRELEEMHDNVLVGETPVRRWAGGLKGKAKTKGKPKPKTDYGAAGLSALSTLKNTFSAWFDLHQKERASILDKLLKVVKSAPDEIRHELRVGLEDAE